MAIHDGSLELLPKHLEGMNDEDLSAQVHIVDGAISSIERLLAIGVTEANAREILTGLRLGREVTRIYASNRGVIRRPSSRN